jgi:hypothetical protein
VKLLLEENPELRMTLHDALSHPWLAAYRPDGHRPVSQERQAEIISTASAIMHDVSMRGSMMNLDPPLGSDPLHVPGAFPTGSQPIQRRRKVLDDAREKGEAVEPPAEMLAMAQRQDEELYNFSSRPNKRKAERSTDTPLSNIAEQIGEDANMADVPPARPVRGTRKGKNVTNPPETPPRAQRGRGRGRGGENRAKPDEQENTDGTSRVRRSARLQSSPGRAGR